ncbi:hypothetical protein Sgou_30490 [Streptomyces gougerotii]|uniref:Uncharacterized protein n=2 Tax=Streptomyces diastaticus group TaxID=2849069 RepID=A0A8H9LRR2_9ACTN|nr:hypothetical protein Srut_05390 [Streptomyces rutgersensis]GFH69622.1 hypothetical protein Sdia_03900 [Streptomyces diastaticus subsp. diastaticus]GFH78379.1 hypothetical protein Sgou_30490 [Streptomyces gougerotii]GGU18438.1 hypothetical protein GCM10015534_21490 [Streptomyces diastaticus subsp. diastaticus]GGU70515.1 hypothetical protein GCM10010227_25710 [Streptomyces gougerotii]
MRLIGTGEASAASAGVAAAAAAPAASIETATAEAVLRCFMGVLLSVPGNGPAVRSRPGAAAGRAQATASMRLRGETCTRLLNERPPLGKPGVRPAPGGFTRTRGVVSGRRRDGKGQRTPGA